MNYLFLLFTLLVSVSAQCECGSRGFLEISHANITSPDEANQCASYKLIDARGTFELQGVSTMFHSLITNILANTTGGISQSVEYPAHLDQNTTSGEKFALDIIRNGVENCPEQKYALFGYSQGATLLLRVIERLDPTALSSIESVIFFGNPYRIPGMLSDVNSTAERGESGSVGMLVDDSDIPRLSPEMDESGKVLDYCLDGDGVCDYDPDCDCEIPANHFLYGVFDSVQRTAFEHVVSRIGLE